MNTIIVSYNKFKVVILLLLLIPFIWFGIKAGWQQANSDFPNYYVSSKLLLEGKLNNAYNVQLFNQHIRTYHPQAEGLFVMYPPSTSLITLCLTPFELLTAKKIWMLMSLIAALGIVYLICKLCNVVCLDAANLLLISGFNLYNDLMLGQVYTVMLFFLLFGWYALIQNKLIYSGITWGLLAAFKFLPLFFIPILLLKKQFKIIFILLISFIIIHLFTLILGGVAAYSSFIEVFTINYMNGKVANTTAMSVQYQSIEVFANLSPYHFKWPIWATALIKLLWKTIWLYLSISVCIKYFKSKQFLTITITSITLLLLLFENGSATYHLLFCLFALVVFLKLVNNKTWKLTLITCYGLMGFLPLLINISNHNIFILNFSRLWCLSLFAACFFIGLKKNVAFLK